ncbi:hypothetical protein [Priestia flexa]|uniref:Tail assembly chaperone n=1 Tax=Priestia flexa TaxID=86664 RepID=A0ABU4J2B3_9BACI|nr:hypothetical protein [Priestia flexa]MDW8515124.1 hypothetical protein [Priestia flexa]MEC0666284.1 hypothetical protein [Priestia flexa]
MPKQVTLQIEKIENDELVVTNKTFIIKKAKIVQLTELMNVITRLVKEFKDDEELKGLFQSSVSQSKETGEESAEQADDEFLKKALEILPTLLVKLPSEALEILSTLSRIDKSILEEQEVEDFFQVYDAVLEENNVEDIIKAVKKSLALTKIKFNFKSLLEKVAQNQ